MPTDEELREIQKKQWSAVASSWERWTEWFERNTGVLTQWCCDAAGVAPGQRVLDVACGSGQPALTSAVRVRPGGSVTAVDLSPDMIAGAARNAAVAGIDNIEFHEMDAQSLTFADGEFAAVTCRFGLMFCPDPARAAAEIHRVLAPGGRAAIVVWDEPAKNPFFTAIGGPLAQFVAMPPPDPKAPGAFRLAPPGELASVLRAGGFADVVVESRPMTFEFDSLARYWEMQTDLAAPLKAALRTLSDADVARLREQVLATLAPCVGDDGLVRIAATPLCATAVR